MIKLPFEEDRMPLWKNIDINKKKLNAVGRWMKELDIYIGKVVVDENLNGEGPDVNEEDDELYKVNCDISNNES